jgi:Nitroreductase family
MLISRRKLMVGAGAVLAGGVASTVELRRMGSSVAYSERVAATRAPLSDPVDLRELVRFGTLAASGHNTQPWRFRLEPMQIVVVPDLTRRTPAVDPAFMRELKAWIRFNPRAAMHTGDGLFSAASGSPTVPSWLGNGLFERLFRLDGENAKYTKQVRSSAGVAIFLGDRADPARWIDVGRSCQRFALQATALGLRCSFINQPVEVAALRPALAGLVCASAAPSGIGGSWEPSAWARVTTRSQRWGERNNGFGHRQLVQITGRVIVDRSPEA